MSKILDLVENASSRKSRSEDFISRFARIYTPAVCIGAVLLGLTETILLSMLGSGYSTIATFAIMLVFLLVRPQGIAGSNIQEKA